MTKRDREIGSETERHRRGEKREKGTEGLWRELKGETEGETKQEAERHRA